MFIYLLVPLTILTILNAWLFYFAKIKKTTDNVLAETASMKYKIMNIVAIKCTTLFIIFNIPLAIKGKILSFKFMADFKSYIIRNFYQGNNKYNVNA